MPGDIGPGPLMCIKTDRCKDCGVGVQEGVLYQCTELYPLSRFAVIFVQCPCGQPEHPWVILRGHDHCYCSTLFVPLGDPDAVIKDTDEPVITRVKEPQYV